KVGPIRAGPRAMNNSKSAQTFVCWVPPPPSQARDPGRRGRSLEVADRGPAGRSLGRANSGPGGSARCSRLLASADYPTTETTTGLGEHAESAAEVRVSRGVSRARWDAFHRQPTPQGKTAGGET